MYEKGRGVVKDLERSFYWYLKAAENQDGESQYKVALHYLNGAGVEKDLQKYRYWLKQAADNNYKVAVTEWESLGLDPEMSVKELIESIPQ